MVDFVPESAVGEVLDLGMDFAIGKRGQLDSLEMQGHQIHSLAVSILVNDPVQSGHIMLDSGLKGTLDGMFGAVA